jgi:undecaprenyl diphosphate synthase
MQVTLPGIIYVNNNMEGTQGAATAPLCIGIIMDGNRRYAKREGLPQLDGHRQGFDTFKKIVRHAGERGVKHLIAYVFSTENWERSSEEVTYLQQLFKEVAAEEISQLAKENIRVRLVGERGRFGAELEERLEQETAANTGPTLWLCVSYGGRAEILDAVNKSVIEGKEVTEESFEKHLWSADMPDPDLIIRTGGEKRLSGFLTWRSVYSELFFSDTLWPDFSPSEFDMILNEFAARERRHGK